jgi:hypothetical protein
MARLRFGRPISLRWNGLLLQGPANTVFEIPDEYYEEFNQDIGPVEPTLEWLDSDEGATLRGRVTTLEGAGATSLSNDAALALGTAASGTGSEASRDDHVHPTTGLALSGHNHDGSYATTGHNHSGVYEPVNTAILKSVVDAKGDLIVGTAADTVDRLPGSGTNGYVLTYDSAETTGLKWAAAPGSGGGASVGNATPLALGTASAGSDAEASREDHVHPTTGLALSGHDHDATYATTGHNHSGVYETAGAVSTHEAASDPHAQYLTETAASSTYSTTGHNHNGAYEVSGAVSTHVAAADPHTQYLTETAAATTYSTTAHDHAGVYANASHSHTQANITDLTTDLAAKAPSASPTFTGTITTPLTTAGYVKTSSGGVLSSSASIAQADVTSLTTDLAAKAPTASPTFTGDVTVNAQGDVRFADSDSSNWVALQAPATVASNVTWTLPSADGTSGQFLSTNGTGTLSWASQSSSGGMTLLANTNSSNATLSVTNIPTTYKDIYIRVHGLSTTTAFTVTGITPSTGNMTGIYLATTSIDNDATYTSTTIVGAVGNSTTTTATKDFPNNTLIEVDSSTYGGMLEIWVYDYANASGQNNGTRYFKTMSISPNGATAPSNASIIVGHGRFTLATATATVTSLTLSNTGGQTMVAFIYGVS